MDPTIRLRLATRIHFALLRHYDEDVGVSQFLAGDFESREALWVCEASDKDELVALAKQFNTATRQEARAARTPHTAPAAAAALAAARGNTSPDLSWAQNTSGFGVTVTPSFMADPTTTITDWLKPSSWLRRGTAPAPAKTPRRAS